jgi:hypothetical protein
MLIYSALMVAPPQEMVALSVLSNALMAKQSQTKMENAQLILENALTAVLLLQLVVPLLVQTANHLELQDVV